jgi:hypothetical protein
MGGIVVIPLVGLVFPILLGIAAAAFGGGVIVWGVYRLWHDRDHHSLGWYFHRLR